MTYASTVENGIGSAVRSLSDARGPLITLKRAIWVPPDKRKAKWTTPAVLVEVAYPDKTATGRIDIPSSSPG